MVDAAAQNTAASEDSFARELRGFGPLGIIAILVILLTNHIFIGSLGGMPIAVPIGATLALLWARQSNTPWHAIGYAWPRYWIISLASGIAFGVAFKFAMKAIVMPLFGADPVNQTYHFLAGNRAALPAAVWTMLVAGFGEETVFRGYLFERLGKLLGPGRVAKVAIVLITSLMFGLGHYADQGLTGAEQAIITGTVFGTIFAFSGRLFMVMCAHATFDLAAVAMIYWNFETRVAHLIFK
jgi:membrane protease YdiL (CAAX protease family)